MSLSMLALVDAKVILTDVEGVISDFTLKARTVFFDHSLEYLVDHLGYPTTVKEVDYAAAYLNGNFWIHKHHCYVMDYSVAQRAGDFFFGLLNYSKRLMDYKSFLEAKQPLDINRDFEQLRSSLEASVISAVFEKTYRSTPEQAREIFEKCKDEEYGTVIQKKLVTDCRRALNYAMYECSEIRSAITAKPSEYLVRNATGIALMDAFRQKGRSFVLKSEWDFGYTNAMMSYVLNDSNWVNRFSAVLVGCKENWMDSSCTDEFQMVNESTGEVKNAEVFRLRTGKVYTGGSAELLQRLLRAYLSKLYYQTADAVAMTKAIRHLKWAHYLQGVWESDCPSWEARVESTRPTEMGAETATHSDKMTKDVVELAEEAAGSKVEESGCAIEKEKTEDTVRTIEEISEHVDKRLML